MPPPRRQAPRYIGPKTTRKGEQSTYDTVRLYAPRTTAEIIVGYILSSYELRNARRVWISGYGRIREDYSGRGGGDGYLTVKSVEWGKDYASDVIQRELAEGLANFQEVYHIDINRRVK